MNTTEMKYALFKEIDSINDEVLLHKIIALVKSLTQQSQPTEVLTEEDLKDIPKFVRNMSVKTDIPGTVDVKDVMHEHWEERYG